MLGDTVHEQTGVIDLVVDGACLGARGLIVSATRTAW